MTLHEDAPIETARLLPQVYDELRAQARRYLRRERPSHTLQPTALVHEAFLRLARMNRLEWQDRAHFLAVAATTMRRLLVEHARHLEASKRGGRARSVTLHDEMVSVAAPSIDLLALDEALHRLSTESARQSRVAELRLFAGMTFEEAAQVLGISGRTAKRDWLVARAWLACELRSASERRE